MEITKERYSLVTPANWSLSYLCECDMSAIKNKQYFTKKLLAWNLLYNNRSMPWKGEKDPYKIWLSEIILQQTRVEQGWAYYERFIKNFPTIKQLAAAV